MMLFYFVYKKSFKEFVHRSSYLDKNFHVFNVTVKKYKHMYLSTIYTMYHGIFKAKSYNILWNPVWSNFLWNAVPWNITI